MGLRQELSAIVGVTAAVTLAALGVAGGLVLRDYFRREIVDAKGRAMARALAPTCARALERQATTRAELDALVADLLRGRDAALGSEQLDLASLAVVDDEHPDASGRERVYLYDGARTAPEGPGAEARLDEKSQLLVQRARASAGDPVCDVQDRWGSRGEALMDFAIPLRSSNTRHGVLWFSLSLERARWLYWRTLLGTLAITALGAALVWFVLVKVLERRILRPILELSRGIERVRSGDLTARVALARKDEFGALVESFNDLVQILRERPALEEKVDEAERTEAARRRLAVAHAALAEAHAELQSTQERLVLTEKQASIGRLVKAVAHELKNPLNMAQNAVPSLESSLARLREVFGAVPQPPDKAKEVDEDLADVNASLELVRRSITRAVSIIHDLQGFSQLGVADLSEVDLKRVLDDAGLASEGVRGPAGRVALQVDVQGADGKPIVLKAFPTLLSQVFVNLFTNAAQAIQGPGTVSVVARAQGDRVRIEVKDSGPGIPAENLPRLFEPFFTTKGVTGTGLGLALCYAYLEKHGGSIEARSEAGKGATFVIDLPVEAQPTAKLGPRGSTVFEGPTDSVAEVARGRRGG